MQTKDSIKYFIIFLMIAQDTMYVYLLRSKDEALKMIKHFIREVENQPSMKNQDDKKGLRMVLNARNDNVMLISLKLPRNWRREWYFISKL